MKRFLSCLIACLPALAYAQAPAEPPAESNPIGTIIFGVLFVGFCIVFAWMVWRNKSKDQNEEKKQP